MQSFAFVKQVKKATFFACEKYIFLYVELELKSSNSSIYTKESMYEKYIFTWINKAL